MKTTLFWISTGLLAAVLLLGGAMDVLRAPPVVQTITALGYPAYVATLLAVWKLLGAAAIAPRAAAAQGVGLRRRPL